MAGAPAGNRRRDRERKVGHPLTVTSHLFALEVSIVLGAAENHVVQ
jgi:hypothetical protein